MFIVVGRKFCWRKFEFNGAKIKLSIEIGSIKRFFFLDRCQCKTCRNIFCFIDIFLSIHGPLMCVGLFVYVCLCNAESDCLELLQGLCACCPLSGCLVLPVTCQTSEQFQTIANSHKIRLMWKTVLLIPSKYMFLFTK